KLSTIAVAAAVFSLWKHQTKDKPQDERRYAICPHHWMLQPKNNTRTTPSCRSQPKLNGFFPATPQPYKGYVNVSGTPSKTWTPADCWHCNHWLTSSAIPHQHGSCSPQLLKPMMTP